MRIAYFSDTYLPQINGITYSIDTFAHLLSPRHEIRIYAPSYSLRSLDEQKDGLQIERYASVPVIGYRDIQISTPNMIKLIRSVNDFKPDLIHYHTPGVLGICAILFGRVLKIPTIGTYHTLFSETVMYVSPSFLLTRLLSVYSKYFPSLHLGSHTSDIENDFNKAELKSKENLNTLHGNESQSELKRFIWYLSNGVYKNSNLIISPSESIKKELILKGVSLPIEVVSNGIDVSLFTPKSEYRQAISFLYVGRLGFEKNVDLVIRAFYIAQKKHDIVLQIVGDGPASENLKMLVKSLNLEQKVTFHGWVERKSLNKVYESADVFVTASTMETQGLTILEAMACGVPVIGVRKYAIPDLVKSGYNGFLAEPFDESGFAAYMNELIDDNGLLKKMGENAVLTASEHDVNKIVKSLENIYLKITS